MLTRSGKFGAAFLGIHCFLSACTESQPTSAVSTTFDTVNGVIRVRNQGQPERWELRELVTLGSTAMGDSANPQEFNLITGVLADAQRNIYVADSRAREIRVFNERGQLLRRFGRRGSGPREFASLQSIAWLGDTLVVMDYGNARLGLVSSSGEWLGQWPFGRISGGSVRLFQVGSDEVYSVAMRRAGNRPAFVFVQHTHEGAGDSLEVPPNLKLARVGVACSYTGAISFFTSEFDLIPRKEPAPNASLIDYGSDEYRFNVLKPPDTVRTIERDLPRIRIADDQWSREERRFRAWVDSLPPNRACEPNTLRRPDAKQMLRAVYFDDQDRTWVERREGAGFAFDVFDASGRLLAQMNAPERLPDVPIYVRGDRLYLVTSDSLDVQYAKAYRIER